jgi:hypothetical protein
MSYTARRMRLIDALRWRRERAASQAAAAAEKVDSTWRLQRTVADGLRVLRGRSRGQDGVYSMEECVFSRPLFVAS